MREGFNSMRRHLHRTATGWLTLLSLALAGDPEVAAQPPAGRAPIGRFLTLESPVTDETIGQVRRVALTLQEEGRRENRPAYLLLEITPGQSQFHHVYALADFLTSPALSNLRTVAWVPESVTGVNALLALSCSEIVMTSEAKLGDLGRGEALPADQRTIALELVSRGRNRRISAALAEAMCDPATPLLQLTIETADGQRERRLATAEEARQLTAKGAAVPDTRTIKEVGQPGVFSGEQASAGAFLVSHLVRRRSEVADLYGLPPESLRETIAETSRQRVHVIDVRGSVDTVLGSFLQRQIARAVQSEAQLIVFEIHSPGGHLNEVRDLAVAIAQLQDQRIRTAAWIPEVATGEAAIIALGCDEIYLAPSARLGAISRRREFRLNEDAAPEQSFLRETLKTLAEMKGRPAAILQAMADPKLRVFEATERQTGRVTYMTDEELDQQSAEWLRGPLVPESGEGLLTVSGMRAQQLMVAEPPVESLNELFARLGLPADVSAVRVERTWVDNLVFALNRRAVTGALFTLALVCIYLELHFLTGFLGLTAIICFALFFWSRFLGGTAGGLEIMLFAIGLCCLGLEVFVLPGFGVFGISGLGLVVVSLVMASQTFGSIEAGRDMSQATDTLKTISISIVTMVVLAAVISRFLPRMPFMRDMVLVPPGAADVGSTEPRLRPDVLASTPPLVGTLGVATTVLRPAGKARIRGELIDVVSNGPFIDAGRDVEVVAVHGNHVVVREA